MSYTCKDDFLNEQEFFVMSLYSEEFECQNSTVSSTNSRLFNIFDIHFPKVNILNILSFVTILIFLFGIYTYFTYKTTENPLIDNVSASSINNDFKNVDFILNTNSGNCESLAKSRLVRICDSMIQYIKSSKNLTLEEKSQLLQKVGILKKQIEELDMKKNLSDNITRYKIDLNLISINLK